MQIFSTVSRIYLLLYNPLKARPNTLLHPKFLGTGNDLVCLISLGSCNYLGVLVVCFISVGNGKKSFENFLYELAMI